MNYFSHSHAGVVQSEDTVVYYDLPHTLHAQLHFFYVLETIFMILVTSGVFTWLAMESSDKVIKIICGTLFLLVSIYDIFNIINIVSGKVYVMVLEKAVKYNNGYTTRSADFSSIMYVLQQRRTRYNISRLVLKCAPSMQVMPADICIPIAWFSADDLRMFKSIILDVSSSIKFRNW